MIKLAGIYFDPFDDSGGIGNTNATVVEAPADAGIPQADEMASQDDLDRNERMINILEDRRKAYESAMAYYFPSNGNTAQRSNGEESKFPNLRTVQGIREARGQGQISGPDFLAMTGRIDAGTGTGDRAQKDKSGNITGYSRDRGTGFTPQAQWSGQFTPQINIPQAQRNVGSDGQPLPFSWEPGAPVYNSRTGSISSRPSPATANQYRGDVNQSAFAFS